MLLVVVGLGGVAAYVASILPPAVQFFAAIAALGALLVVRDVGLTDHLAHGVTAADAIAWLVRLLQSCCWQFAFLLSVPGITGADVNIVMRGLSSPDTEGALDASEDGAATAADAKPSASALAARLRFGRARAPERGYAAARDWLRRPRLQISLGDQLELYGLYQRAENENFADAVAVSAGKGQTTWLARAKMRAMKSCLNVSQAAARTRLASTLARADPLFAVAHPECAMPDRGDSTAIVFSMAERRLPQRLPAMIDTFQRRALLASATMAAATLLRAAWLRASGRAPKRCLAITATLSSACAAYMLALLKGLPMDVHVAIARLVGSGLAAGGDKSGSVVARLFKYLAILVTPRASRSLFAQ